MEGMSKKQEQRLTPGTTAYVTAHQKVAAKRGAPSLCESCGTSSAKRFEWANQTGHYNSVGDYKRLCVSCHRSLDQRRAHNRREDHKWKPCAYESTRCDTCNKRRKLRNYYKIKSDPDRYAKLREQNRRAARRFYLKKQGLAP